MKKTGGAEARLCYLGHLMTENRHGLIVDTRVTPATGTGERDAAEQMAGVRAEVRNQAATLGADRVGWMFPPAAAAYNLVRMRNLAAETA